MFEEMLVRNYSPRTLTTYISMVGRSETKYPRKYGFLDFTIKPIMQTIKGKGFKVAG